MVRYSNQCYQVTISRFIMLWFIKPPYRSNIKNVIELNVFFHEISIGPPTRLHLQKNKHALSIWKGCAHISDQHPVPVVFIFALFSVFLNDKKGDSTQENMYSFNLSRFLSSCYVCLKVFPCFLQLLKMQSKGSLFSWRMVRRASTQWRKSFLLLLRDFNDKLRVYWQPKQNSYF